jgi:Family of unknown function (DUF6152)
MQRRTLLISAPFALILKPAFAHHGWSSFDETAPLYLEGKIKTVKWQNPHAELVISVPANLALPADMSKRAVPAQQNASVNAPALLAAAKLPKQLGQDWTLELAPLTRIEAWKIAEPKAGDVVSAIGYTFMEDKNERTGERKARIEFLFLEGKAYALRSGPA